ncbi:MAG: ABC transporter permease [Acidobacteria bacterium]|nr:ABC transporter permease [Acidobacteriota bacterium]
MRALRYAFDEALTSLGRGWHSGLLATATIALALFVLGAFLLVTANLERLGAEWSGAAEMSVYLKDDVTDTERRAIDAALAPGVVIASHEYASKAAALARFKRTFGELASAIDALGDNPLPASFEVRLRPGQAAAQGLDALGQRLQQTPGVVDVRYDRQWLDRLLSAIAIVRGVGLVLGSVLTFAAALTVANVVRLALYARRDELDIMQLVGAPQVYIRGPFVMEGMLQGGIGAAAALVGLAAAFLALRGRYLVPLASAINFTSIQFLPASLCVLLVVGGMAVGCLGGLVAAWKS